MYDSAQEIPKTTQNPCTYDPLSKPKQLSLPGFGIPFDTSLDKNNRWVKLGQIIPWDNFAEAYYQSLSDTENHRR